LNFADQKEETAKKERKSRTRSRRKNMQLHLQEKKRRGDYLYARKKETTRTKETRSKG